MAGDSCHVLVPPYNQGIICRVHLGRGAVDAGKGEQFARDLRAAMWTVVTGSGGLVARGSAPGPASPACPMGLGRGAAPQPAA